MSIRMIYKIILTKYPSLTYSVIESANSLVDCIAFFFNCSKQFKLIKKKISKLF